VVLANPCQPSLTTIPYRELHRLLPPDGAVPYQEVKCRTNVVGIFPDDAAVTSTKEVRRATAELVAT
jgi:hypothetical protein